MRISGEARGVQQELPCQGFLLEGNCILDAEHYSSLQIPSDIDPNFVVVRVLKKIRLGSSLPLIWPKINCSSSSPLDEPSEEKVSFKFDEQRLHFDKQVSA